MQNVFDTFTKYIFPLLRAMICFFSFPFMNSRDYCSHFSERCRWLIFFFDTQPTSLNKFFFFSLIPIPFLTSKLFFVSTLFDGPEIPALETGWFAFYIFLHTSQFVPLYFRSVFALFHATLQIIRAVIHSLSHLNRSSFSFRIFYYSKYILTITT